MMLGLAKRLAASGVRPAGRGRMATFPAPVGGLNLKDSIADMDPLDALILDNYTPESNHLQLRRGSEAWATGITGNVDTVAEWSGPAGRKLKAINAAGSIFDVSSAGAVGAAEVTGLNNGRFQAAMMATSGGHFLVICNGADDVRNYDGTAWTAPAITGVASSELIQVVTHKNRLWFVQAGTTKAWYLAVNSIAGAATELDLGPQFRLGGKLQIIVSLSRDAGDGADDFLAFVSSRGEAAVYQGTDPSTAATWALVGRYRMGVPIGNRPSINVGGDAILISQDGIVSMTQMIDLDRSAAYKASVTNRIDDAFSDAFLLYGSNFGWQAIAYPKQHYALINIPVGAAESWQYVMNTQTGAWCRFKGQNARCWSLYGDDLFFGLAGGVHKADTGSSDNGANIVGDIKTSFQYFGAPGVNKHFKLIRPMVVSNGNPGIAIRLVMDFADEMPDINDIFGQTVVSTSLWDVALWDVGTWGASEDVYRHWLSTFGLGTAAAVRVRTQTNNVAIRFNSFDAIYEKSGMAL